MDAKSLQGLALQRFQEYLRIPSISPRADYVPVQRFLEGYAEELGLSLETTYLEPEIPVVVMTLEGTDPTLPSLYLNSHMDVVPVELEMWSYPPFEAQIHDGKVYARGSQDMKCLPVQYLEAIRRLKQAGKTFKRTIHLGFTPEEELGSYDGMAKFVLRPEWKKLNVGHCLDEGLASPSDKFRIFYSERARWWLKLTFKGNVGHGSRLVKGTAAEKFSHVVNEMHTFKAEQIAWAETRGDLFEGDIVNLNMTVLRGGVQTNVVPGEMSAAFDIRISPKYGMEKFRALFNSWIAPYGDDVVCEFELKDEFKDETPREGIWWEALRTALESENEKYQVEIFPAGTDSKFMRNAGYESFGFSPMNRTPILLHDHDEYLGVEMFERGVQLYMAILHNMANC